MAVGRLNKEQKRISRLIQDLQSNKSRYRKRIRELGCRIDKINEYVITLRSLKGE